MIVLLNQSQATFSINYDLSALNQNKIKMVFFKSIFSLFSNLQRSMSCPHTAMHKYITIYIIYRLQLKCIW